MGNNPTIKDVAKLANVSISTVSRTLNNSQAVDDALKERVWKAAKDLGYMPNEVARNLKRQDSSLIAYVVSNTADPFFTAISRGVEDVLYENGYNLINCSTNFSVERENSFLDMLSKRRVAGIIINTVGNNDENIGKLSQQFPIVLSNRYISSASFMGDFVDFDNISGVMNLTKHLISLGHKKIAYLSGPTVLSTARERQRGFREAMQKAGINTNDDYPYIYSAEDSYSVNDGYFGAARLMSLPEPPTAIIASNSEMAIGAMSFCREHGISIPDDVSLCSFGDLLNHDLMYVNLTHTRVDLFAMGNRMATLLIERINNGGKSQPNREIRFDSPIVLGNSTAAPKKTD